MTDSYAKATKVNYFIGLLSGSKFNEAPPEKRFECCDDTLESAHWWDVVVELSEYFISWEELPIV